MNLAVGAQTDVGRVRRANEDSFLLEEPVFAVADGMGGHIAGDVASATAVEIISQGLRGGRPRDPQALAGLVSRANEAIIEKARSDSSLRGMGTTCTLVMIDGDVAHFAHVGDSRAYLYRDGSLRQVTEDHTLVERMVREGKLSAEEAARHPQRSVITRALGVDSSVKVDLIDETLRKDDRILIASDGLTSMVAPADIAGAIGSEDDPQAVANKLVDMANEAGGEDNITVLVLHVGADGSHGPPPGAPARRDTRPGAEGHVEAASSSPNRAWVRPLVWGLVLLVVIGGAAAGTARWVLSNSWFVGLNEDRTVTIYQGIPEEIAGRSFNDVERETDIAEEDLPQSFREDIEEGRKFDSVEEAETYITNLEERIEEIEEATERTPERRKK